MPVIDSRFQSPTWLRNGHAQTILSVLLPRRVPSCRSCASGLELDDGDFSRSRDWLRGREHSRVAILSHGLEGSSTQRYVRGLGRGPPTPRAGMCSHGDFLGCSGEINRLLRFYHSGETGDLAVIVRLAATTYPRISLAGFSLGGNVTLKYLGEAAPASGGDRRRGDLRAGRSRILRAGFGRALGERHLPPPAFSPR
jgi:predicted alpha/beta-fold hydrolase